VVHPTLFLADYGSETVKVRSLPGTTLTNLPIGDCAAPFAAAPNPIAGKVEVFCRTGKVYRYGTRDGSVEEVQGLGFGSAQEPSVACEGNLCAYGYGLWNPFPNLPSSGKVALVENSTGVVGKYAPPDQMEGAVPIGVGFMEYPGKGRLLAVLTQGRQQNELAVHGFDTGVREFVHSCTFEAELLEFEVGGGSITLAIQRGMDDETSPDVVIIDPLTCGYTNRIRLPVPGNGTRNVGFVKRGGNTLYVGGGDTRTNAYGVWAYASGNLLPVFTTTFTPFTGTYSTVTNRLYVGLRNDTIVTVNPITGRVEENIPWVVPPSGGTILIAE
jgi:hypothetical protein